ncbi:M4 family metallopeptidase [Hymenobacter sp. DG25A]|uniref:M4 family metallopeptidase n=1 Tax=Hymenobacter sp. DG25A TaxID=1385663 RepID=UPI0006C87B46|nr:M4 family metallopeptidase [Hymenobacter sp. DG25A]
MQKKYSVATLLMLGGLLSFSAQAQDYSRVKQRITSEDGQPELISFRAGRSYKMSDAQQMFREQLALSKEESLVRTQSGQDDLGMVNERYQQYYKGIKVENGAYLLHARQGDVQLINGRLVRGMEQVKTTPSLSEEQALSRAMSFVGASKFMWQDAEEEAFLKKTSKDAAASYKPKGELVIVRNTLGKGAAAGKATLAYKFDVYAQAPVSRAFLYVDAQSGEVISKNDIIKHAGATATFATAYSGTRSFADETATGGYRLRELTRGLGIETYNMKKGQQYSRAVDFIDADNNWTAAEYNNANFDNVAGDAHFGAQATYDYWKNVHGRNSFDNAGAKIKSYVHYGRSYENAYWNGSVMTYGDGATRFRPLTAMDVCGHEIGHAVCEKTANLVYSNESGAMNEGFSDIWGACVEAYAVSNLGATSSGAKAKSTWLIGEEIDKQQAALRSMSDPNSLGQPAYYKGLKWYTGTSDNGGVHTNSGVLNYWFYLIADGKTGTNEKGQSFSVTGLGMDAAGKIAFRAESVYLTASSTYANARTASIQAAQDLYGVGSVQEQSVTNAWYAVGVGSAAVANVAAPAGTTAINTGFTVNKAKGVDVFPVPATNELTVSLRGAGTLSNVRVIDMRGATVTSARYKGDGVLDISTLAKGLYMVSASDGEQTFHQRFVKE